MTTSFRRFAWGILFVLLDIHIGSFDILPDIIGYLFLLSAVNHLGQYRSDYLQARRYAIWLAPLSLVGIFLGIGGNPANAANDVSLTLIAYESVMMLLLMLLIQHFLTALLQHAEELGASAQFIAATNARRRFFLIMSAGTLLLYPFMLNSHSSTLLFTISATGVLGIIALLMIFATCRRAAVELARLQHTCEGEASQ